MTTFVLILYLGMKATIPASLSNLFDRTLLAIDLDKNDTFHVSRKYIWQFD